MEQQKNDERQQRRNGGSAVKEMPRHHEGGQSDMNRDKRDAKERDTRDSTHGPNQPSSVSHQRSQQNPDQEKPGNTKRAEGTRFESSKSSHVDRVFNTPIDEQGDSD